MSLFDNIKNAWNVFNRKDSYGINVMSTETGRSSGTFRGSRSALAAPVYNRIALDVSTIDFKHKKTDSLTGFTEILDSELSKRLSYSANLDQTGRAFIQDAVYMMMDAGHAVLVPTVTTTNPDTTDAYDIKELRVGRVVEWFTESVRVNVYDMRTGNREDVVLPKSSVAIVYNPLYDVMNDQNGTLSRLLEKLNNLDKIDSNIANGRLRLLIKLPYSVQTKIKKQEAEERIKQLEEQIAMSRSGIGYLDATEDITDLSAPLENTILDEINQLTTQFYNQLGLSAAVFDGTAKEDELRIYYSRTIDPVVEAIVDEINRKFISQTARTQGQVIVYHRNPFKLMPIDKVATIADTFKRNEILNTDEIRELIGYDPANEPGTNELSNPNIADVNQDTANPSLDVAATGSKDPSALEADATDV